MFIFYEQTLNNKIKAYWKMKNIFSHDAASIRHKLLSPLFKRWIGYEHDNFRGRQYLWDMSERGEYNCYDKWCAQVDHVSSVRAVKQVNREAGDTNTVGTGAGRGVAAAASETCCHTQSM